jgi:hypothetical protein
MGIDEHGIRVLSAMSDVEEFHTVLWALGEPGILTLI